MFYHGSNVGGLKELKSTNPRKDEYGKYIFFSSQRLYVVPYLCNPWQVLLDKKYGKGVKKIRERIAPYNFKEDGTIVFLELWPNFFEDVYKGQTGYIYSFESIDGIKRFGDKVNQYVLDRPIKTENMEVIPDIYEEMLNLERQGLAKLERYHELSQEKKDKWGEMWLKSYKDNEGNFLYQEVLSMKIESVKKYIQEEKSK